MADVVVVAAFPSMAALSHKISLQARREMRIRRFMHPPQPCPFLPAIDDAEALDHSLLRRHGSARDSGFYFDALRYGHFLWQQGHAGRALLALTRALYADVPASDDILRTWSLPYAALLWILKNHSSDDFPGNPRLSYQHQACRLRGERSELRAARAWALWALTCAARPHLPGDPTCPEPSLTEIAALLDRWGHPGESQLWQKILQNATTQPFANS
jgi:hypothetical protein